jgi:dihydroorotate dehydrogenase (NAD+) catalytic subunit
LNISCPNVSGGVDFGTDPRLCYEVVRSVRDCCHLPVLAKLTPNVTNIAEIARAAADAGADAVCCINTLLGMAVDWRNRKPMLGNVLGGLSGPAIKPVALRCVYQVARAVNIPVVGIGGIATLDYYDPTVSQRLVGELPAALRHLGARRPQDVVRTIAP